MNEQRQIFTLKQVASSIKKTLEERYQRFYWIKCEMHKLNMYPSGHAFPELVQKEDGKIVAQLTGQIWKANLQRINQQFVTILKEPLKEGTTLLMQVKIVYSELYGISLQIYDIDPNYSLGELQRERQETLLRLKKEGLLNKNQTVPFPLLPQRIAIISADTSKGLSDFMKVLNQNRFGYAFFTHLFFAALQGDAAIEGIQRQLQRIEQVKQHFDVVVIVRGGGGEVGMTCYNNYDLCAAIANCSLPVLTGIGHSTNLTVAEMISYRNFITPTELGEFLLQVFHEFREPLERAEESIVRMSQLILENTKKEFSSVVKDIKNNTLSTLMKHHSHWQIVSRKLNSKTELAIDRQRERLQVLQKQATTNIKRIIKENTDYLVDAQVFIQQNLQKTIEKQHSELQVLERQIRLLDPKNVLKRGYSIARVNGSVIAKDNPVSEQSKIVIETFDYQLTAKVETIEEQNKQEE